MPHFFYFTNGKEINVKENYKYTIEEWEACIKVLSALKDDPFNNPDNQLVSGLITKVYKTARKVHNKKVMAKANAQDKFILKSSVISTKALNNTSLFHDESFSDNQEYQVLNTPRNCYSCNGSYQRVHFFYSRLCPTCAELNYNMRFVSGNLTNRSALITGGRVKVGYATALKLLRAGANVTVTSRFPAKALENYSKASDYDQWKNNLTVYGLDLRNLKDVESFLSYFKSNHSTLDILINNAAQTIKYDDAYYLPVVDEEMRLLEKYSGYKKLIANQSPVLEKVPLIELDRKFDDFQLNRFGQPVDNRTKTSWNSTLEEISVYELLEVNLINQISPYILIKDLMPLMKQSEFEQTFIINVTSSEGQFSYHNKTIFHPHTNMTKAALNMMTRTSAKAFENDNILMYAVDVGWISTGAKEELRKKQFEAGYIPPLDSVDGAARIMNPIYMALNKTPILTGTLLKNYKIEEW